eukprot:925855_1
MVMFFLLFCMVGPSVAPHPSINHTVLLPPPIEDMTPYSQPERLFHSIVFKMTGAMNTLNATWLVRRFEHDIMKEHVFLHDHRITGRVLDACAIIRNVTVANTVWEYITNTRHAIKPTQLQYSKMMCIYNNIRNEHTRDDAQRLVHHWIYEYQHDPASLKGHLTNLELNSPVILNQMMRLCGVRHLGSRTRRAGNALTQVSKAIFHQRFPYFQTMLSLGFMPDHQTEKLIMPGLCHHATQNHFIWLLEAASTPELHAYIKNHPQLRSRFDYWDVMPQQANVTKLNVSADGAKQMRNETYGHGRGTKATIHACIQEAIHACIQSILQTTEAQKVMHLMESGLFDLVNKTDFRALDERHGHVISNHLQNVNPLYLFQLEYQNGQAPSFV